MFRDMRRKKQVLPNDTCIEVLGRNTNGVLAVSGDDGYPYAVPLSYIYNDGAIYFHTAKSGHKLDAIRLNDKASFCVVDKDEIVPAKMTSYFRSVIAFGRVAEVTDADAKRDIMRLMNAKYSPIVSAAETEAEIDIQWSALCVLKLEIEHLSGKEAIELVRK